MASNSIKSQLHFRCLELVESRISISLLALEDAQASANEESKSTAGDKQDTSRAMMQLEVEKLGKQLYESEKMKEDLLRIKASASSEICSNGSLVFTSAGNYFISVAAGKIELNDKVYFAISILSPIAQVLKGHKKGDSVSFNGKKIILLSVE